jgi:hypothetical protein
MFVVPLKLFFGIALPEHIPSEYSEIYKDTLHAPFQPYQHKL